MTLTLELPPEAEAKRQRPADQRGQPLSDYALDVLLTDTEGDTPAPGESVYESMKDFIGTLHSGGDGNLSQNTGEKFAEGMMERKRQGRL